MAREFVIDTSITYEYNEDNTVCQVKIDLYDEVFNKVDEMVNNFLEVLEIPFEYHLVNSKIYKDLNESATIELEYKVLTRSKTKMREQMQAAYISAKDITKSRQREYFKKSKMSKTRIKKAYALNDQLISQLPNRIYSWDKEYKREIVSYFVEDVENLIDNDEVLLKKQQKKVSRGLTKFIQRLVEAEIEGEAISLYEFKIIEDKGESFRLNDKINYTMNSFIIGDQEYVKDTIKTIYTNNGSYYISTTDGHKYDVCFNTQYQLV